MSDPATPETPTPAEAAPASAIAPETRAPAATPEEAHAELTAFEAETTQILKRRAAARPHDDAAAASAWDGATNDTMVQRQRQRLDLVRAYHNARAAADAAA